MTKGLRLLLSVAAYACIQAPLAAQTPCDSVEIRFVGFNADSTDSFSFVALTDIPMGCEFWIRDDEWSGVSFNDNNEGAIRWVADVSIAPGTVVVFEHVSQASSLTVSHGVAEFALPVAGETEALFVYTGLKDEPRRFLTAIGHDGADGNTFGSLDNTELTSEVAPGGSARSARLTRIAKGADIAEYTGPRSDAGSGESLFALLINPDYWTVQDEAGNQAGDGIAPDLPFARTDFSVPVGVDERDGGVYRTLRVYPNPGVGGLFFFSMPVSGVVTDIAGKTICGLSDATSVRLPGAGLYFLHLGGVVLLLSSV